MRKKIPDHQLKSRRKKRRTRLLLFRFLVSFVTRDVRVLSGHRGTAVEIRHVLLSAVDRATPPSAKIPAVLVELELAEGSAGLAESLLEPLSREFIDLIHSLPGSLSESQARKGPGFSARLFLPSREELEHDGRTETDDRWTTASRLEAELALAQAPVVERIREWVHSQANTQFETKEDAQENIDTITHLVRRAGHQLIYRGVPVTLAAVTGTRQTRPTIQVRGRSAGKNKVLLNSVNFPELSIRPLPQ